MFALSEKVLRRFIFSGLVALSLIALAPGGSSLAQTAGPIATANERLISDVSGALDASDYTRLEQILAEAHRKAVETRDFKPLRATYRTLFAVTHRDRLKQGGAWLAAVPGSPYAATALAAQHYQRVHDFRGTAIRRYVSPYAATHYAAKLNRAGNGRTGI